MTHAARARRADRQQGAVGPGQPAVHRADAGRRARRHAGHRRGRRHQRRPARGPDPGARGRRARQAARGAARQADGVGSRGAARTMPEAAACARRSRPAPPSASWAAASSAACWRWPPRASASRPTSTARRAARPSTWPRAPPRPPSTIAAALAASPRAVGCRHLRVRERARSRRRSTWPRRVPVRPGAKALEVAQDRLVEKQFIAGLGIPVAPFRGGRRRRGPGRRARRASAPGHPEDAPARLRRQGPGERGARRAMWPRRGTRSARSRRCSRSASPSRCELSALVVRSAAGELAFYDCPRNTHEGGILRRSVVPSGLPEADLAARPRHRRQHRRRARLCRRAGGGDVPSRRPTRRRPSA